VRSAEQIFDEPRVQAVNEAVAEAERRSGARIMPVVATSSGRYEWAEDLVGLWAAALGLALTWSVLAMAPVGKELAATGKVYTAGLLPILLSVVIGFVAGAVLATKVRWLRGLFISRKKQAQCVRERARQIYNECYMNCGGRRQDSLVLIYVSLYEKAVEIVASDEAAEKLPPAEQDAIRKAILDGLAHRQPEAGIRSAVQKVSGFLGMPADANEGTQQGDFTSALRLIA